LFYLKYHNKVEVLSEFTTKEYDEKVAPFLKQYKGEFSPSEIKRMGIMFYKK